MSNIKAYIDWCEATHGDAELTMERAQEFLNKNNLKHPLVFSGKDYGFMGGVKVMDIVDAEFRCVPFGDVGMEWGLKANKEAAKNLARAILEHVNPRHVELFAGLFAHDVVMGWPEGHFKIKEEEVLEWLERHHDLLMEASR